MALAARKQTEILRLKVKRKAGTLLPDLGNGADDDAGQSVSQTTSTSDLRRFVGRIQQSNSGGPGKDSTPSQPPLPLKAVLVAQTECTVEEEDSRSWSVPVIRLRRAMASVPMCSEMLAAALSGHPFRLRYVNVSAPYEGREPPFTHV